MALGKKTLIIAFALLGFIIGAAIYFALDLIVAPTAMIGPLPGFVEILTAPWFISGIAGALLSVAVILVFAKFSHEK